MCCRRSERRVRSELIALCSAWMETFGRQSVLTPTWPQSLPKENKTVFGMLANARVEFCFVGGRSNDAGNFKGSSDWACTAGVAVALVRRAPAVELFCRRRYCFLLFPGVAYFSRRARRSRTWAAVSMTGMGPKVAVSRACRVSASVAAARALQHGSSSSSSSSSVSQQQG